MSLDQANGLYTSKQIDDVISFYDHFPDAKSLIDWMKARPSAEMKIFEEDGDREVVVVIPTADHAGRLADSSRELFKGMQVVFVESNGPFFNYSRSCNYGLRHALKYNPKWVILSNDDEYKIDDMGKLRKQLRSIDNMRYDALFITRSIYHSNYIHIVKLRHIYKLSLMLRDEYHRALLKIINKYDIKLLTQVLNFRSAFRSVPFFKPVYGFWLTISFSIFSPKYIGNRVVFDEALINGGEDILLSYMLSLKRRYAFLDFQIGDRIGTTLGTGRLRSLKDFANRIYIDNMLSGSL